MVFSSFEFALVFLPLAYVGFVFAHRLGGWQWAINLLAFASLVFYGMWGYGLLAILVVSILFNFSCGRLITRFSGSRGHARAVMIGGIFANLAMLGYLKYTNFLIDLANQLTGAGVAHVSLLVPIGVSFFTFVQIGYLIDAYNNQLVKHDLGRYIVFSAFFPCVTAGPLVMQREMFEQMRDPAIPAFELRRLLVGLTMFGMGLFKKVVLADTIAPHADALFSLAAADGAVGFAAAWVGSLCYALQLYFDFSGYSDMALGLGLMFGLKLPLNFNSPFKATNISDFWRRWHMTMTRFFTNYVYSGLAMKGMRQSMAMRYGAVGRFALIAAVPAIVTFEVAGIWHGAGWTYVVYGLVHGLAIATYLGWREFSPLRLPAPVAWALTMSVVVSALVLFRAHDLGSAGLILSNMWGLAALGFGGGEAAVAAMDLGKAISLIVLLGAITLLLPNTQQMLHRDWPTTDDKPTSTELDAGLLTWKPAFGSAVVTAATYTVAFTLLGAGSSFLYYQF